MSKPKSTHSSKTYIHYPARNPQSLRGGIPLTQARANAAKALSRMSFQNSNFISPTSGEFGDGDRTAYGFIPRFSGNPYDSNNFLFRWQQYCHLYETSWEAKKIINIPVDDALRKDWIIEDIPEDIATYLMRETERLGFKLAINRAMKLERLLGGCINFFGIDAEEDDPEKPYDPKKEMQKVRFINTIPVSRIAKPQWDSDPLSAGYMRAKSYMINGNPVHVSRCLVWDGEPLFDPFDMSLMNFRLNQSGFGPSKLAPIWNDIEMAMGVRRAAYQMTKTNNALIAAVDGLQDLQGTSSGRKALQKVKDIANQISAYRAAIVDGDNVNFSNLSASFGSVPELIIIYLQVLSAASDIPATRFLGQAPGGLNATGESDLENYYNMIDSIQMRRIDPAVRRFFDLIAYPKFKDRWHQERENLDIKYPPLWNLTELEEADRNAKIIDNAIKVYELGEMTSTDFWAELNNKSVFTVEVGQNYQDDLTSDVLGSDEPAKIKTADELRAEIKELRSFFQNNYDKYTTLIEKAGENPKDFDLEQFKIGMKVELEHKDVTHGNELETAKITLAHLKEKPDYYTRLKKVENSSQDIMSPSPIPDLNTITDPIREVKKSITQGIQAETKIKTSISTETGTSTSRDTKHENKIDLEIFDDPTKAQIEAGNYRKHHLKLHGLDISIENPKGSFRRGVDPDGVEWETELPAHYGYLKRTKGNDDDAVDVYIGDDEDSENVYIVNQHELDSNKFDEHKCILGVRTWAEARNIYEAGFSDGTGPQRYDSIHELTMVEFKEWLKEGDTTKPYGK